MKLHITIQFFIYYCSFLSMILIVGCNGRLNNVGEITNTIEIDFSEPYERISIPIQDLGNVRYIPLSISDSSMLGSPYIVLTDKHIITSNSEDNVIIYNSDGSLSHTFNHRGKAGFEYTYIDKLIVDPNDESIYVVDNMMFRAQHYDINGEYMNTVKLPANLFIETYLMDSNILLCVDRRNVASSEENENAEINSHPFYSVDLSADSLTPVNLPWTINNPVSDLILFSAGSNVGGISLWTPHISTVGDRIIVSEALEDTIYEIKNGERIPIVIKRNNPADLKSPKLTTVDGMNSRYIFLYTQDKGVDFTNNKANDPVLYVFDSEIGNWCIAEITNNDISEKSGLVSRPRYRLSAANHHLPEGVMVQVITADKLCELRDSQLLNGELKKIAESYSEEGNPILIVLKLNN